MAKATTRQLVTTAVVGAGAMVALTYYLHLKRKAKADLERVAKLQPRVKDYIERKEKKDDITRRAGMDIVTGDYGTLRGMKDAFLYWWYSDDDDAELVGLRP